MLKYRIDHYGSDCLKNEDHRQSDVKFGMFCFVTEQMHSADGSKRTAADCNAQKGLFRNAPLTFFGPLFVHAKADKSQKIYCNEIHNNIFCAQKIHSFVCPVLPACWSDIGIDFTCQIFVKHFFYFLSFPVLSENPHNLCDNSLSAHIVGLENTGL